MAKEISSRITHTEAVEQETDFETVIKNHRGFIIPLEMVRKQIVTGRINPRRMWGPLIAENEGVIVIWYADAMSNIRLRDQDRDWNINHPVPFENRHVIPNTEDFSEDELELLRTEHANAFSESTDSLRSFFQRFRDDERFQRSFTSLVTKACQEVDRLLD